MNLTRGKLCVEVCRVKDSPIIEERYNIEDLAEILSIEPETLLLLLIKQGYIDRDEHGDFCLTTKGSHYGDELITDGKVTGALFVKGIVNSVIQEIIGTKTKETA